jgi:hypothetical protein
MTTHRRRKAPKLTAAPVGPTSCFRSAGIRAMCCACDEWHGPMHSPLYVGGIFCSKCCPVCNPTVAGNPAEVVYLQGAKA